MPGDSPCHRCEDIVGTQRVLEVTEQGLACANWIGWSTAGQAVVTDRLTQGQAVVTGQRLETRAC
jgi:hypothetical protein